MRKSTIWILAILMGLTFLGLLFMQIIYMKNMIQMRENQFSESVKQSLYTVSEQLAKDEAQHFFNMGIDDAPNTSIHTMVAHRDNDKDGFVLTTQTPDASIEMTFTGDTEQFRYYSGEAGIMPSLLTREEIIRNMYNYHRELIDEIIIGILSQSNERPIMERADSTLIRRHLKSTLAGNGLTLPFEFAIVNNGGGILYKTADINGTFEELKENGDAFEQSLFTEGNGTLGEYSLIVYFPTKNDYISSSLSFMVPSLVFTLILMVIFVFTIIVAFRQKKLTEMKNDFINNMTHEFKTPISSISLAAQMLNDETVLKSSSMLQHISSVITDETKRLRFQVEKVLQMSMFDRSKAALKMQDVEANAVIDNIVHTFKLKVERYGGTLTSKLNAEDAVVYVDEMHFTNVIFNLLDNAVKYRKEDVALQLSVSTRNINEKLEIVIEDNGIGIKKEYLKKIFEKFYRVSTGNRHDVKGFGLGLAYVHKMIAQFNGEINVESELNKGTKFTITLPITKN